MTRKPEFYLFTSAPPDFVDEAEPTDDIGVIGFTDAEGVKHPAMTSNAEMVERMKDFARGFADQHGVQVKLIRFSGGEIIWSTHS